MTGYKVHSSLFYFKLSRYGVEIPLFVFIKVIKLIYQNYISTETEMIDEIVKESEIEIGVGTGETETERGSETEIGTPPGIIGMLFIFSKLHIMG